MKKEFLALCLAGSALFAKDLFTANFDSEPMGTYTKAQLSSAWNKPTWNDGVDEGRCVITDSAFSGKALAVRYHAKSVGTADGGAQWKCPLNATYDSAYAEYKIMFPKGFLFAKGGKLPGLGGGTANTGGNIPTGTDGFTARLMWRSGSSGANSDHGYVVNYLYHVGQPSTYGDDRWWLETPRSNGIIPAANWAPEGVCYFEPGKWHTVKTFVKMNTPGLLDGQVKSWFNGKLVLVADSVEFRRPGATFGIDLFYFSTFFGGSDSTWATPVEQSIYFDEFRIFTEDPTAPVAVRTKAQSPVSAIATGSELRFSAAFELGERTRISTISGKLISHRQSLSTVTFDQPLPPGVYFWTRANSSGSFAIR